MKAPQRLCGDGGRHLNIPAGIGLNRLVPWQPAWMKMEGVHWAGGAVAVAGRFLATAAAGLPSHDATSER